VLAAPKEHFQILFFIKKCDLMNVKKNRSESPCKMPALSHSYAMRHTTKDSITKNQCLGRPGSATAAAE
jgi:hypothetical protein